MKGFLKSLYWLGLSVFYGLVPVGIAFFVKYIDNDFVFTFDYITENGLLIFFCIAISASVMVDYIFLNKKFPKWAEYILYAYPWFLVVISSILYSLLLLSQQGKASPDLNKLLILQIIILIFTFIYTIIIKTIVFLNNKIKMV
jgi:hypothetical protein